MRTAILVPGRFYAFDLALAFTARNHNVKVFTNYPAWAAKRFGLPGESVVSFWLHGVVTRAVRHFRPRSFLDHTVPLLHTTFGKWASKQLSAERWDIVHAFS